MQETAASEKAELRRLFRKEKLYGRIIEDVDSLPFSLKDFDILLTFIPLAGEVDVSLLADKALALGLDTAVPSEDFRFFICLKENWRDTLQKMPNKTLSPVDRKEAIDITDPLISEKRTLIILPALACTKDGRRLGRGGGFYDRILAVLKKYGSVTSVCVLPKEHILDNLPSEPHDMTVDYVLGF